MLQENGFVKKRLFNKVPLIFFLNLLLFSFTGAAEEENTAVVSEDASVEKTIQQHLDEISRLETTHGPHHEAVGENLISLSNIYQSQGDHANRLKVLTQALHIHRINHGLESKEQLQIIEQLIATNTELKDWWALDQNYEYFYWVNRRIHGTNSLELIPAINRVMEWKLMVLNKGLFGHPEIIKQQAADLLRKIRSVREVNVTKS